MRRREFISGLGTTAATSLVAGGMRAHAQTPKRVYRLGHLANSRPSEASAREVTLPELARLGFVEGRNLVFDARLGESDMLPGLMRELLAAQPDAVIAVGGAAIAAAGAARRTVPIVTFGANPIELGLAANYARPGRNVTGVVILASELEVKRLSILLEAVPDWRRVAILTSPATAIGEAALRKAAVGLGVELLAFPATAPADYPAVAQAGCLIGYGPDRTALRKRMADQIAQIFRGVPPGDIAIETPTVLEFAINRTNDRQISRPQHPVGAVGAGR